MTKSQQMRYPSPISQLKRLPLGSFVAQGSSAGSLTINTRIEEERLVGLFTYYTRLHAIASSVLRRIA
jgi:hypothetical protein